MSGGRWQRFRSWLNRANPEPETLVAIGRVLRYVAWFLIGAVFISLSWQTAGLHGIAGVVAILGLLLLICLALWLVMWLLARLPNGLRGGLLLLAVPLVPVAVFSPQLLASVYLMLALTLALLGAGVVRYRKRLKISGAMLAAAGGLPLMLGLLAFLVTGWQAEEPVDWPAIQAAPLSLPDPAEPGPHDVLSFSYGSGSDRHRPEFAEGVDWRSDPVDGSSLIDGWEGIVGWARSGFWGFDAAALPVQGRGWMPDGAGPFPLVLIVHGNHEGTDFSDVGYAYLGEHFASRGVIAVSVDENFLNSFTGDLVGGIEGGLDEESDGRGWMLLQHLVQWRKWVADESHPMHGKADLNRVVLIGHSRGGEAVSEAALFNRLSRYPDDGTLAFDFDFGIRGIIAIAPVDHQYHPRDRDTPLEDVSLLTIHGSHDSDVDAFAGSAMYSRLAFMNCDTCFKSSFYLVGANHGQFNTSWGRYDAGFPAAKMLNVQPLMDGDAQRQFAKVLFSAFLEVVLFDREAYRPFLARPETGDHWFPEGESYLANYSDPRLILLADFEEDADLTTGSADVRRLSGEGLSIWKEAEVPLRWRDVDSAAVLLGWGGEEPGEPAFELVLLDGGLAVSPEMALSFSAAMATVGPEGLEDFEVPESLSFDVVLTDRTGGTASVSLSDRRPLYPQIDPVLYKLDGLGRSETSEPTFQRYVFQFSEWQESNPALDLASLTSIRFEFPKSVPASVWLDDIAISPDGY
jgi:dienelactone hydrolase